LKILKPTIDRFSLFFTALGEELNQSQIHNSAVAGEIMLAFLCITGSIVAAYQFKMCPQSINEYFNSKPARTHNLAPPISWQRRTHRTPDQRKSITAPRLW
jgi:hypothetical protein